MCVAIVGACMSSFGTTRKKFGIDPFVSAALSAEPETNGSLLARLKTGATASTSRLAAGPTTASTLGSRWKRCAASAARRGASCVSASTRCTCFRPRLRIA